MPSKKAKAKWRKYFDDQDKQNSSRDDAKGKILLEIIFNAKNVALKMSRNMAHRATLNATRGGGGEIRLVRVVINITGCDANFRCIKRGRASPSHNTTIMLPFIVVKIVYEKIKKM